MKQWRTLVGALCICGSFFVASADAAILNANPTKASSSITERMAVAVAGDVIMLEPGLYTDVASGGYEIFPIQVKAGVTLLGYGSENTRIESPAQSALAGDSTGVTIDGLAVTAPTGPIHFVQSSGSEGVVFRNSKFVATNEGNALDVYNTPGAIVIENCQLTGYVGLAVASSGFAPKEVRIHNTIFTTEDGPVHEDPIWIMAADKVTLTNVSTVGFDFGPVIYADGDVSIDGCDFEGYSAINRAKVSIRNSVFKPGTYNSTVSLNVFGGAEVKIANTLLSNGVATDGTATVKLFQCYDSNLDPVVYP